MSLPDMPQLGHEPLWDRVYDELRKALLAGKFAPGDTITLRSAASALGTSPTPVRDALLRLTAEGILVQGPRRTPMVPMVTATTFQQILDVRVILEGSAVAAAAALATDADCLAAETLHRKMWDAYEAEKYDEYLRCHREFHFCLYKAARNPFLTETIENLWLRCAPILAYVVPRQRATDAHADALDALRKRDGAALQEALVKDIKRGGGFILAQAGEDGIIHWPGKDGRDRLLKRPEETPAPQ